MYQRLGQSEHERLAGASVQRRTPTWGTAEIKTYEVMTPMRPTKPTRARGRRGGRRAHEARKIHTDDYESKGLSCLASSRWLTAEPSGGSRFGKEHRKRALGVRPRRARRPQGTGAREGRVEAYRSSLALLAENKSSFHFPVMAAWLHGRPPRPLPQVW